MKKSNKKKKIFRIKKGTINRSIMAIVALLLISIGASYAYFTATISGSESSTTITVGSAVMNITYSGGSAISASNVIPGWSSTSKSITVTGTNTNSVVLSYTLTLKKTNTFSTGALKYTLTNTTTGGVVTPIATVSNVSITNGSADMTIGSGSFAVGASGVQHTYTFIISFPETSSNQNTEQGKSFTGYITTTSSTQTP
ncbi:MAG: hypothetical protein PHS24_02590 [Bacilli bacterium]|nr:hypothetical protein [Bacilli bacterium]